MSEQEVALQMAQMRQAVRKYWNDPGVKALVQLVEIRAARLGLQAVSPGAGPHDQGQAFALQELVGVLNQIRVSEEVDFGAKT